MPKLRPPNASMRKKLAPELGLRKKFKAIFGRVGRKKGYHGYAEDTILLNDVVDRDTGKMVADHVWFAYTKGFEKAGVVPGDALEFEARVKTYEKGYVNARIGIRQQQWDYKLSHPTRIKILKKL